MNDARCTPVNFARALDGICSGVNAAIVGGRDATDTLRTSDYGLPR